MTTFLKTALNSIRKARGLSEIEALDFLKMLKGKQKSSALPMRCSNARSMSAFQVAKKAQRSVADGDARTKNVHSG